MDILYLVDRLEELINEGWHIPMTSNVVIDDEEFLDIIDQMRISVPEEIKQAKRVQQEKELLLIQAKEESDRIIAVAREENRALISEHEVLKVAQSERQAIIEEGRKEVETIRKEADAYVIDVLSQLEDQLSGLLTTVHNGVLAMQQQARERSGSGKEDRETKTPKSSKYPAEVELNKPDK